MLFNCGIYAITNTITNKRYVGSSKNIARRFKRHKAYLNKGKHHNQYLQRSYDVHGERAFTFDLLEECSVENLKIVEQRYIDENVNGYNIAKQASGGDNITNNPRRSEIVQKQRDSLRKRNSSLTDNEKKVKFGHRGIQNGMFGRKHSSETIQKFKARKYSEESVEKMKKSLRKLYETKPELRLRLSEFAKQRTGLKNSFYGRHHAELTKQMMGQRNRGRKPSNVTRISINEVVYASYTEASKTLNVHITTVRHRVLSKSARFNSWILI